MLRILGWLFGFGLFVGFIILGVIVWFISDLSKDLPDYEVLADYQPPVTTRVHAADGSLLAEYARERRLFQAIETIPPLVIHAFLSAEDKNFYTHGGIAIDGIIRAARDNITNRIEGVNTRLVGASTITQQVAKNFLLSGEQTIERKIKEAILSLRIESTFTKDEILELYLNEIFFGFNSYGIAAAALNYFNKALYELKISEAAYLAAVPKGPNNYHPFRRPKAAIDRRNWVISKMAENGYITQEQAEEAKKDNLDVIPRASGARIFSAQYFTEEVRRELIKIYGEDQLYGGGLSVRTTLNPTLQNYARQALMEGLVKFDQARGFHAVIAQIDVSNDWGEELFKQKPLSDVPEWTLAVVLEMSENEAKIGLRPPANTDGKISNERIIGQLPGSEIKWVRKPLSQLLKVGDVFYVEPVPGKPGIYTLDQEPEIEGSIIAMDPRTGRVLALVGGFSFAASEFNRATQAMRQPGSTFKPIVYAAALDNGYTPASVVLDAPLEIQQIDGTMWRPENYAERFYGPQTLRRGIERSRNVMTVRLAKDIGMPLVSEYARIFGIYDDLMPVLAMALGSGETTNMRLTSAFATIGNGGRKIIPTLIDRIQDRRGNTIFKHDERVCDGCNYDSWDNHGEPMIIDNRESVLDPMTAYQITSMMQGVIQRGTGTRVKALGRPVAGKTGTSSDYKDAWFIGFTPELAVGVYVGYDTPRSMGRSATGGELAAPIFTNFVKKALEGKPVSEFIMPSGMSQTWIDPATGIKAVAGEAAILEAFKPGSGPNLITSIIGVNSEAFLNIDATTDGAENAGRGGLF